MRMEICMPLVVATVLAAAPAWAQESNTAPFQFPKNLLLAPGQTEPFASYEQRIRAAGFTEMSRVCRNIECRIGWGSPWGGVFIEVLTEERDTAGAQDMDLVVVEARQR